MIIILNNCLLMIITYTCIHKKSNNIKTGLVVIIYDMRKDEKYNFK